MTETADIARIKRLIPHRYPFLLVDRVIDIEGAERATGIKNVSVNEPQFNGHFPQEPVFPGVLMIEALAQTAAVLVGASMGLEDKGAGVYFMSVDGVKFRRKVGPGDVLKLHVETLRGGGKVWKFRGRAEVDGETACECEFAAMMNLPKD